MEDIKGVEYFCFQLYMLLIQYLQRLAGQKVVSGSSQESPGRPIEKKFKLRCAEMRFGVFLELGMSSGIQAEKFY